MAVVLTAIPVAAVRSSGLPGPASRYPVETGRPPAPKHYADVIRRRGLTVRHTLTVTNMSHEEGRLNRQREEGRSYLGLPVLDVFDRNVGQVFSAFTYDPTGEVEWVAIALDYHVAGDVAEGFEGEVEGGNEQEADTAENDGMTSEADVSTGTDGTLTIVPFCCTRLTGADNDLPELAAHEHSGPASTLCVTIPYTYLNMQQAPTISRLAADVPDSLSRAALAYYSQLTCFDPFHWFERPRR